MAPHNMHPLALLFQTRPEQEEEESVSSKVSPRSGCPCTGGACGAVQPVNQKVVIL